jgi:hypothetical protein
MPQLKEWGTDEQSNTNFKRGSSRRPQPMVRPTAYVAALLQQDISQEEPGPGTYELSKVRQQQRVVL